MRLAHFGRWKCSSLMTFFTASNGFHHPQPPIQSETRTLSASNEFLKIFFCKCYGNFFEGGFEQLKLLFVESVVGTVCVGALIGWSEERPFPRGKTFSEVVDSFCSVSVVLERADCLVAFSSRTEKELQYRLYGFLKILALRLDKFGIVGQS